MESNIGSVICDLRKQRGMTQERLAEMVGVSTPAVSKWETNASCPDVALLAPIARALDTDVNTLLSFSPVLSKEGMLALLKEVQQLAQKAGAALERMREAVRRYPNDAQLRYQLACFAMSFPHLFGWNEEQKREAQAFAEEGLEYAHRHGEQKLSFLAAYTLAGLLLNNGELDRAEALLDTIPMIPLSPQALYTLLYQKRGDKDKARGSAQIQLASGATAVLNSLLMLSSSACGGTEAEIARAFHAYQAVANVLGYPHSQTEILLAAHELERGQTDQALDRLLAAAHYLMEQEVPGRMLWSTSSEGSYREYRRSLSRLLQENLLTDPAFHHVRQDPRYVETLDILAASC